MIPHPNNKKYFDDISGEMWTIYVNDIADSGIRTLIIADRSTRYIIHGHQRTRAALELGLESVPVIWRDYKNPEEAEDDLIRDNVMGRDLPFY